MNIFTIFFPKDISIINRILIVSYCYIILGCTFQEVKKSECPTAIIRKCTMNMAEGELCDADEHLPDGSETGLINNCGKRNIFKCTGGEYLFI